MIQVSGLTKKYGKRPAIEDISFTVPAGQIAGLLGLNGAGKSTTMNIIAGCLSPGAGTVTINGCDMAEESEKAKRCVGYLPETPPLYADMKAGEYLDFIYGLKKAEDRIAPGGSRKDKTERKKLHIGEICARTGIEEVYTRLIKNLSKGYRQRLGLAAALVGGPEILVLDEPTVGLDPAQIIDIRNLIAGLGKTGTVIFSSHILSEVQALCDRVIVLHEGRVAADLGPQRMMEEGSLEETFISIVKGARL
ncbi:MAG: ABC transporter ATP-binding protein [Treponema sp.]|nr:ABC transporter ATP-binding protein [Treponema sp.]